jgi:hypothetical protein
MQAFIQSKHWFSIALAIGLATLTTYLIACDLVILTISLVAIFSSQMALHCLAGHVSTGRSRRRDNVASAV